MNQIEKGEQRQLWISRLSDMGDSELTQEEWCRRHNIPYSTFRYWARKLKQEADSKNQPANWLKVDLTDNAVASLRMPDTERFDRSMIRIKIGEFTVELQDGCDPQRIVEVLRILKAV
jgi:hypothetical protein